ncbi:MAG: DUF2238 domain-containing protein [Candidatus Competibacteraceae bacterium]
MTTQKQFYSYILLLLATLIVSGIGPYDRLTWLMETAPVMIAIPIMLLTHKKFPLTELAYSLIFIHCVILMIGGHYTYAKTPVGFWLQHLFDLARNPYDRIGHFAQGFVPAILTREILIRVSQIPRGKMLNFLVLCVCLAISACYEFIEWWAALLLGQDAEQFLATQGDIWDTQWDMFMALIGAITALLTLSKWHDKQLNELAAKRL